MTGTSSTIAAGPHTKPSVCPPLTSGFRCSGVMRPRSQRNVSVSADATRVACRRQLDLTAPDHAPQLAQVREVFRRAGAVEQLEPASEAGTDRVSDHRPDWGDSGAAGNEQQVFLSRSCGIDERSERSVQRNPLPAGNPVELVAPATGRLDLDQELQLVGGRCFFRRRGNRVGNTLRRLRQADHHGLPGLEAELRVAEIEADDARRGRRATHAGYSQNDFARHLDRRDSNPESYQLPTSNSQLPRRSQPIDREAFGSWELEVGS